MDSDSKFHWKVIFIGIPLLPFLIGGIIKLFTIILSQGFQLSFYNIFRTLYFSWDTVAFSFSISIIAFFVKNDLINQKIMLPNQDKINDVAEANVSLLVYIILSLISFGLMLLINTLLVDCKIDGLKNIHIFFSIITYFIGFSIIKKSISIQQKFNLTSKIIF